MADEARLKELKTALDGKMAEQKALADSFQIEDGTVVVEPEHKTAFDKNMTDIKEIKSLMSGMKEMDEIEAWANTPESKSAALEVEALTQMSPREIKTLGEAFLESAEYKALEGGRNGYNMNAPFSSKAAADQGMQVKDVYSDLPTGTPGSFGRVERDAIVLPAERRNRIRSLFPARSTTAAVIEYFRLTGFTNNAATVPERDTGAFGAKPQSNMTFVGSQAPVRTIAHWEAAHRNVLADEPQLRSIIDNELLYGLRLEEDDQILNGNGVGENLTGILDAATGVQQYSWSAGATVPVADGKADAVRRAATLAYLAYYEPTGAVLHPNDWEDIELFKDANGQYLMSVSIQAGASARMWRMPVIDTPAITEGTALIGAFGIGAQLYDREGPSVRISEQHADFFVRNAIVVLAEQRLALAVKRPESFVEVTFDSAPV